MTKWTSTPPTVAGWYWLRFEVKDEREVVHVYRRIGGHELMAESVDNWEMPLHDHEFFEGGEWQGPITPQD